MFRRITTKKKNWIRRGDIEKEREKKYLQEKEEEDRKREEKRKQNQEQEEQRLMVMQQFMKKPLIEKEPEPAPYLKDPEEVIKRLRHRGEVVTFFGETDEDRSKRLHKLEELDPLELITGGVADEFGKTLRKLENDDDKDEPKKKDQKKKEKKEEDEVLVSLPEENPLDSNSLEVPQAPMREFYSLNVYKKLLKLWNQDLQDRPEVDKRTSQGKIETATFKQTKSHIKILFKQLKSRTLPEDLLNPLFDIAHYLEEKEYVKAHDAYLRMAIGNAPWPMGVTNVGIHERSAREKINQNQIAHVLNDETQRKYIQAVKRLMTFCQQKYPTDPSKTVG